MWFKNFGDIDVVVYSSFLYCQILDKSFKPIGLLYRI